MECNKCNLGTYATCPCQLGKGKTTAKVMLIADSPSRLENDNSLVFKTKSAINLKKALAKRGIEESEIYCTYAIKCPQLEGKEINQKNMTACKSYLQAEMNIVKPKIIVPLGNAALKMTLGKVGITKFRGKAFTLEDGTIIFPMIHPSTISRNPSNRPIIQADLDNLKDIHENGMPKVSNVGYKIVDNLEDALSEIERLGVECRSGDPELEWLSFDIEATGNNPYADNAKTICISLSNRERTGTIIPLFHRESTIAPEDNLKVIEKLKELLESTDIKKVAQNGKFDIMYMHVTLGIYVRNFLFDTMLAHYLCVSEKKGTQGLKSMAWEYTDMGGYDNNLDKFKETLPEADRGNYENIPWSILSPYGAADADCTLRLLHIFKPMIDANPKWKRILSDIYIPATYALIEVEEAGMHMNLEKVAIYQEQYEIELKKVVDELNNYPEIAKIERDKRELYAKRQALLKSVPAKERSEEEKKFIKDTIKYKDFIFNWSSSKQLKELFYDVLELKTEVKTGTGELSTNAEALEELADQHPIPNKLVEYRKLKILKDMFIDKIPEMKDRNDCIHPSFLLTGTETCRLASIAPNAQQLPRHVDNPTLFQYKYEPKGMFNSRFGSEGCVLNLDYSQLEIRLAAVISEDKAYIEAYKNGEDAHTLTAASTWKIPVEEVTPDLRTAAKAVGFGCIYGKSGNTFGRDIYMKPPYNYPEKKALKYGNQLLDNFKGAHPELAKWLDDIVKFAKKNSYVENMFGFRRRLPEIHSKDRGVAANAERQSKNSPVQGTGSYCTIISIIKIVNWLKETNKKSKMVCTVHDSIVFDVYLPELPEVAAKCKELMESALEGWFDVPVPLVSELELGKDYGSAVGVELEDIADINSSTKFNAWWKTQEEKKKDKAYFYLEKKLKYTPEMIEAYKSEVGWN